MHSSPLPSAITPFHHAANAGAGVAPPPPPSESPFNAGRVDWEKPTARLTADFSEQEAQRLGDRLLSGESLRVEENVPQVVMEKALKNLVPGTHLMLDLPCIDSYQRPADYQLAIGSYLKASQWIPAGVNLHVCKNTNFEWEESFIQRVHSACPLVFRGVLNFDKLKFEKKYANSAYLPILPGHSQETAIAIAQHALLNQAPIFFEEGVTEKTIMAVCDVTPGLSIMLPLPEDVLSGDPFALLTDDGGSPKILVPHSSMSVREIKNVVKEILGYSFMLKMDPTMYPEAIIVDIAKSTSLYSILLLQTEDTALITQVAQNITCYGALKVHPADTKTMAAAASHLGYYGGLYFDASNQAHINTAATNLSKSGMLVLDKSVSKSAISDAVRNLNPGGLIYLLEVSDDFFITMAKELPENCRIVASDSCLWGDEWARLIEKMQKNTVLSFYKDGRDNSEEKQEIITLATRHSVKIEFDFDLAKEMLSENPALMGWYTLDPTSGELVCYEGQDMSPYGFDGLPKPPVAAEPVEVAP